MFIIGLTGSIGMGKSETSKMFQRLGIPVFDADAVVHNLLGKGGRAVKRIEQSFPGVTKGGAVDRAILGAKVFEKRNELRRLEMILHPLVGQAQKTFLTHAQQKRKPLVVLDIPLLFEGLGEDRCDATAVVSAPYFIQRQRVLSRPNMHPQKFDDICRHQVPDFVKQQRADFVVPTGLGRRYTLIIVTKIMKKLDGKVGRTWPPKRRPQRRSNSHPSRRPIHARNRIRHRNNRT